MSAFLQAGLELLGETTQIYIYACQTTVIKSFRALQSDLDVWKSQHLYCSVRQLHPAF